MKNTSHAFINQVLVCLLVTFCASGSIGLGTVWMRHQISLVANENKALEQRIAEMERQEAENKTTLETEQSNDLLRKLNTQWNLGLVAPQESTLMRVAGDPMRNLAAKNNRDLFNRDGAPVAFRVSLGR